MCTVGILFYSHYVADLWCVHAQLPDVHSVAFWGQLKLFDLAQITVI